MNLLRKIESNNAPKAIGPYSPAVKLGDFVYLSGQLGMGSDGVLVSDDVVEQTHQAMKNIGSILAEVGLTYRHIVKTTVFVKDMNDFAKVNEVYGSYFVEGVYPARSCVEVARLPKDAKVEIECMVLDTLVYEQQYMAHQCGGCGGGCGDSCDDGCCGGCE